MADQPEVKKGYTGDKKRRALRTESRGKLSTDHKNWTKVSNRIATRTLTEPGKYFDKFTARYHAHNVQSELEGAFLGVRMALNDVGIVCGDGYITPTHFIFWVYDPIAFTWDEFTKELVKGVSGAIILAGTAQRVNRYGNVITTPFLQLEADNLFLAADGLRRKIYKVHDNMLKKAKKDGNTTTVHSDKA